MEVVSRVSFLPPRAPGGSGCVRVRVGLSLKRKSKKCISYCMQFSINYMYGRRYEGKRQLYDTSNIGIPQPLTTTPVCTHSTESDSETVGVSAVTRDPRVEVY